MPSPFLELAYHNRAHPHLEIECFTLSELRRRMPEGFFDRLQRPRFHLLSLYVAGEGRQEIDFVSRACAPGTLLHVHPGQVVRYLDVARAEALMLLFTPAFAWAETEPVSFLALEGAAFEAVRGNAEAIAREYATTDAGPASAAIMRHLLMALLLRIEREARPEPVAPPELFQRFRQALEASFASNRKVEDYAATLGCSPRTLNRAVLAATGTSAKHLVDQRVALEAKRLLAHTPLTVSEVAARLHFSEPTNFVKFFRREAGQLPLAFRASYAKPE